MSRENSEEIKRADIDCWCPRQNQDVLILGDTCFFREKKVTVCRGCVFDGDFVSVKIVWLLTEMLEGREKRKDDRGSASAISSDLGIGK